MDSCDPYWKDHCEPLGGDMWKFRTGEVVLKDDPSMEKNEWHQCAIRRHEYEALARSLEEAIQ